MDLVKGEGRVFPNAGKSFDPTSIPTAIHDAGFTATEVDAVMDGRLASEKGALELNVPGLNHPFILAGGAQLGALKQANLAGKQIRVTGTVSVGHGASPPNLTVEAFQPTH